MSIYIVAHKDFHVPSLNHYIPIQVGKSQTHTDLGWLSDDTGDHISEKNPSYCELTALYWLWKNCTDPVIGLCHYRRYFTRNPFSVKPQYYLSFEKAMALLEQYDIILPEKIYLKCSVQEKYASSGAGFLKDLEKVEQIIAQQFPEYLVSYRKVMNSKEQYFWNMFILKKHLMDEYCSWLFAILSKLEQETDLSEYDSRQRRIYGYISERLLNVWVEKNELTVYECPVVQSDQPLKNVIKTNIGIKMKHRKL